MIYNFVKISPNGLSPITVIHSGTLLHKKTEKVTKFQCSWCFVFRAPFQYFLRACWRSFCGYAVSSFVCDHNHPYLFSERLFLAENQDFPYSRRAEAHSRIAGAILWDAAATWPVAIFVVVAANQRSPKPSVPLWIGQSITDPFW